MSQYAFLVNSILLHYLTSIIKITILYWNKANRNGIGTSINKIWHNVLIMRKSMNMPTIPPSLLMRSMSVILTALADLTRNITEILVVVTSHTVSSPSPYLSHLHVLTLFISGLSSISWHSSWQFSYLTQFLVISLFLLWLRSEFCFRWFPELLDTVWCGWRYPKVSPQCQL